MTLKPMQRSFSFQRLLIGRWRADALLKCPLSFRSPRLNLKLLVEIMPFVISQKVFGPYIIYTWYLDEREVFPLRDIFKIVYKRKRLRFISEKSGAEQYKGLGLFSLQASCQQYLHVSAFSLVKLSVFCTLVNFLLVDRAKFLECFLYCMKAL